MTTATTKAEPWEFFSAELGAIFDTRNAKWKEQYYRLWLKHNYPQDKGRWVLKKAFNAPANWPDSRLA